MWGCYPAKDYKFLEDSGVSAIFGPGTNIPKATDEIIQLLFNKKGRNHDLKEKKLKKLERK